MGDKYWKLSSCHIDDSQIVFCCCGSVACLIMMDGSVIFANCLQILWRLCKYTVQMLHGSVIALLYIDLWDHVMWSNLLLAFTESGRVFPICRSGDLLQAASKLACPKHSQNSKLAPYGSVFDTLQRSHVAKFLHVCEVSLVLTQKGEAGKTPTLYPSAFDNRMIFSSQKGTGSSKNCPYYAMKITKPPRKAIEKTFFNPQPYLQRHQIATFARNYSQPTWAMAKRKHCDEGTEEKSSIGMGVTVSK